MALRPPLTRSVPFSFGFKEKANFALGAFSRREYLVSTSDGSLPVHRQQRDYPSGPTVSTCILLRLTAVIRWFRPGNWGAFRGEYSRFLERVEIGSRALREISNFGSVQFLEGSGCHSAAERSLTLAVFLRECPRRCGLGNVFCDNGSGSHHRSISNLTAASTVQ